ncbi:MAG: MarR family transcriptional regulator [bacterium]|nr:MarR family transcriptional regulator [bacterium]
MPQNILNTKVLYALWTVGQTSKLAQLQMFRKNNFEITPEQYIILAVLVENGELYQRQIGEICYKDRPNVTRLLNILEEKELIKRVSDVNKRQIFKIQITDKGRQIHSKIRPHMINLHNKGVLGIQKEELEDCLKVLVKMVENLEPMAKMQK